MARLILTVLRERGPMRAIDLQDACGQPAGTSVLWFETAGVAVFDVDGPFGCALMALRRFGHAEVIGRGADYTIRLTERELAWPTF